MSRVCNQMKGPNFLQFSRPSDILWPQSVCSGARPLGETSFRQGEEGLPLLEDEARIRRQCLSQGKSRLVDHYFSVCKPKTPNELRSDDCLRDELFPADVAMTRICDKYSSGAPQSSRVRKHSDHDCGSSTSTAQSERRPPLRQAPPRPPMLDKLLREAYQNYKNNFYSKSQPQQVKESQPTQVSSAQNLTPWQPSTTWPASSNQQIKTNSFRISGTPSSEDEHELSTSQTYRSHYGDHCMLFGKASSVGHVLFGRNVGSTTDIEVRVRRLGIS